MKIILILLRQFLTFAGVGAVGTAAHYAIFLFAVSSGVDPVGASVLGFASGAVVNYLLNYHITFRARANHRRSATRFAALAGTSLVLNTLLMALAVHVLRVQFLVAQVLTTGVVLCWNFVASRWWAFKEAG